MQSLTRNRPAPAVRSPDVAWHSLSPAEALTRLETSPHGLSDHEVAARREKYGPNRLPEHKPVTLLEIIWHQLASPLIYILIAAGVVSVLIGETTDALFIFAVIVLNSGLGTFQEWRAERSAAALQSLLQIRAVVQRRGERVTVPAENLVPGDIVFLESGSRVPADLRLVQEKDLTIDEAFLTGESVAAVKDQAPLPADTPVADRTNMAYAGAVVMSGRGVGVVVATGLQTEIGRIAEAATGAAATKPPLVIRMERFVRWISVAILVSAALLAVISTLRGTPLIETFFMAVALAVSAIPEGLPVAMTVALSIAVGRMARRRVIVRRMTAVEGLGSCTYIASDKTGTLTVNRQTVKTIWLPSDERLTVAGEGYAGEGEVAPEAGGELADATRARVVELARAAVICNDASLRQEEGEWRHSGDAMDVALLALGYKLKLAPGSLRRALDIVGVIPFESERRYAATAYRAGYRVRVSVKGAMETVLPFCQTMRTADGDAPLDAPAIENQVSKLADAGYRVLAVAEGVRASDEGLEDFEAEDIPPLTLLGLVGFIDPLRPEAKAAVDTCRRAGVEVGMITGDHPATAGAIARELGLIQSPDEVIAGYELADLAEGPEFKQRVASAHVFARVTPIQKLQIVEALREQGHFVAVTGDGVNDAPAMRAANIGVAMGSGTDLAKDTASIIVTDDNFASIVEGIEEGRFAYANIRKVIYLLISTGAAEVLLFLAAILTGLPLPLLAVQLLWLNLVTNGIQDVALAFEGGEPGAMRRSPRPPTEGIFNQLMIQQTAVAGAAMWALAFATWVVLLGTGWAEEEARNLLLLLMVLFQNFHVFNCRSEYESAFRVPLRRNRMLVWGVTGAFALHMLALHLPFMQTILRTAPVTLPQFLALLLVASLILVVMEVFKLVKSRRAANAVAMAVAGDKLV